MTDKLEDRIAADLKTAMLARDAGRTSVLRSLKSAFIYAKVAPNQKLTGEDAQLTDEQVVVLVAKEAKKRQESADAFDKAGQPDRVAEELAEKKIIDEYLPVSLTEDEVRALVDAEAAKFDSDALLPQMMGQLISAVKAQAGPTADGGLIARLVKERLAS
jgi:uncharacterized protein YqeY